jgi:hypothetical protein
MNEIRLRAGDGVLKATYRTASAETYLNVPNVRGRTGRKDSRMLTVAS